MNQTNDLIVQVMLGAAKTVAQIKLQELIEKSKDHYSPEQLRAWLSAGQTFVEGAKQVAALTKTKVDDIVVDFIAGPVEAAIAALPDGK